jgi:hypothetical protein
VNEPDKAQNKQFGSAIFSVFPRPDAILSDTIVLKRNAQASF